MTVARSLLTLLLIAAGSAAGGKTNEALRDEVRRTEAAFAKTMADRDHPAFTTFLAAEAIFVGGRQALRGQASVAAAWKPYFDGEAAPFSWAPDTVEVLDSGTLALSSGPVFAPDGRRIGTFNSVWRREEDGRWRIVFDKGCPPCDCGEGAPGAP